MGPARILEYMRNFFLIRRPRQAQRFWYVGGLAVVYYSVGALGIKAHLFSDLATFIWAPAGISIAALILGGRTLWPGIAIGAFLVSLEAGVSFWGAMVMAIGNTLQALIAASIMRADPKFGLPLRRIRDVTRLIFIAIPIGAAVSSTVGVWCAWREGMVMASQIRHTGIAWWGGNLLGSIVIVPLALAWVGYRRERPLTFRRLIETVALGLTVLGLAGGLFFSRLFFLSVTQIVVFAVFPLIIWAAVRFSVRGVATVSFLISMIAVVGVILNRGPSGPLPGEGDLFFLNTFLAIAMATGLLLASAIFERETAIESFKTKNDLQEFIDNMSIINAKIGVDGKFEMANRIAVVESGLDSKLFFRTKFIESPWWNFDHTVKKSVLKSFEKAISGKSASIEVRMATVSQGIIPVSLSLTPVFRAPGQIAYLIAEAKDLGEQRIAEYRLRMSEAMLSEAQRIGHLGSWEWKPDIDEVVFSDELYRIHGITPENFQPTFAGYLKFVHPDDREDYRKILLNAVKAGSSFVAEKRVFRPDRSVMVLRTRGVAMRNEQGKVVKLVGLCQDITTQKATERERAELLTRERTARQESEAANRTKDIFLAVLSHELRTPLTAILSWAQLLQMKVLDAEKTQKGYWVIEQNARSLQRMINDLLDISRIMAGKLLLETQSIDPCFEVLTAVDTVQASALERHIDIRTELSHCYGTIEADPVRFRQIMWNLLSNAIGFTQGGGEIQVKAESISLEGRDWARITVSNTGKGISPEFLPHLFDLFVQADSSSTRHHGGLGIGLSIVKKLTDLQHGRAQVYSEGIGKGASFTVEFPLKTASGVGGRTGAVLQHPLQAKAAPRRGPTLSGIRLLLVEDDPNTNDVIAEELRVLGVEVFTAYSAEQGLDMLLRHGPQVLVSDIAMPEEDGYSLIRKVRKLPNSQYSRIPAIALSAYATEEDRRRSLSSGFQSHISKPVDFDVLAEAVARAAGRTAELKLA